MSELKPCPFCGGKNMETSYKDTFGGDFRRGVYCADCCGGIYPYYDTEAEAVAAWNTRAERTCENEKLGIVDEYGHQWFKCSECKCITTVYNIKTSYCPNCGAKVVEE